MRLLLTKAHLPLLLLLHTLAATNEQTTTRSRVKQELRTIANLVGVAGLDSAPQQPWRGGLSNASLKAPSTQP